jgi:hypothetical protein
MSSPRSTTRLIDLVFSELGDDDLDWLCQMLAPRMQAHSTSSTAQPDGWLDTARAAEYLGISKTALHKHTAAQTVPFEQDIPGGKCWFLRSELDDWRRGQMVRAAKTQPRSLNSTNRSLVPKRKTAE